MLSEYKHPYVTVDLLLFSVIDNQLAICLTKRDQEPFKDMFALPGSFVRENESAEGAVERLLSEKLELTGKIYTEQLQTFSDINRDPRERVISIAYLGIIPDVSMVKVPWMQWFTIKGSNVGSYKLCQTWDKMDNSNVHTNGDKNSSNSLDGNKDNEHEKSFLSSNLGFDHDEILQVAVDRLKAKIDYTDIIFKFLVDPHRFTAGMLRQIYQSVTGQEINRGNFTKYQMNTYMEHGLIKKTGSVAVGRGRPADTYSYIGGEKLWIRS
ncbi:NUDIX hydrolase [Butyrivibrio sp. VCB2006]|uniref:NUDIX hydrolase n=1 Tax=Butyrivibrio sp. VCB2006 TaxID=1280679 RepID=UPI000426D5F0|nr:NUDIX domain-containing protein [Butyrivibrio sp. VCB2006]